MIKYLVSIFIFSLSLGKVFAQEQKALLDSLRTKFENFEYSEAIYLADNILSGGYKIENPALVEIYLIKGTSYFSLWNRSAAKECFEKILNLDPHFIPDPVKISPKVIAFFDEVKLNFDNEVKAKDSISTNSNNEPDISKSLYEENLLLKDKLLSREAVIKSIIFPGWGQQCRNYSLKGWLLTSLGLLSLGSSVYFIIDSNQKETNYINETDNALIQSKYDKYNKSYKLRNISISLFTVTWLYSLFDIIFISN
jgi:tetratricopeptide (TPR) repeat protein